MEKRFGKSLFIAILSILGMYLFIWASDPIAGFYGVFNIIPYLTDPSVYLSYTSTNAIWEVYVIVIMAILVLISPIIQLLGAKFRVIGMFASIFILFVAIRLILLIFIPLFEIPVFDNIYYYFGITINTPDLPIPISIPLFNGLELGLIFLIVSGIVGIISFIHKDED